MSIGDFLQCKVCRDWGWFGGANMNHVCKPRWECRGEWLDDSDWEDIHAYDAETAAEKYAERYDREGGEYTIVSSRHSDWIILVRKPGEDDIGRWVIKAETVPQYRATEADPLPDPPAKEG